MKNNNKKPKLRLHKKNHKRIISYITAFAIILTNLYICPFYEISEYLFGRSELSAEAAYEEWVEAGNVYNINSPDDLAKYSSAYRYDEVNDPSGVGHSKDTLIINIATDMDAKTYPFYSIGQVKPFRGVIELNRLSDNFINIDQALFDQIGEETVIKCEGSNTSEELVISRTAPSTDPIFAKKVVAKESGAETSGTTLGWVIRSKTFLDTGNPINSNVAGLIGEIAEGASVKIAFYDERCMNVASSTGDVGYICGTMGANAALEISALTTATSVNVTASGVNGDAGAIVGSMGSGAILTLPASMTSFPVTEVTASGNNSYAGGIVGNNNGGSVAFSAARAAGSYYTVNQTIGGKLGSGGLYGYYCPALTSGAVALSYDDFLVDCSLNGTGSSGGLFGRLESTGNVTINDTTSNANHIKVANAGKPTDFGGLIGLFSTNSLDNALTISSGCTSKPSQSGSSTYYGGAIGTVDGKAYVRLNGFATIAAGASGLGGAVGRAEGAFIDVNGLTVTATVASNGTYDGGGVVNKLGNGVLRLDGTIDLTNARAAGGQIVKERDSGLVFAEPSWSLKRSGTKTVADDIGSWGEVVHFQNSGFTKSGVLTHSDGDHYVTLLDAVTTMSSASDFARTALNIQHNTGTITDTTAVLRFTSGDANKSSTLIGTTSANGTNLSLGASFSLAGTGMQGLTRDDGSQTYKGATFNGGGYTLTLAIGEAFGNRSDTAVGADDVGSGRIYKHTNVGLFGKTDGATIQNVTFAGNIYVGAAAVMSVGTAAAENAGGFTAYGVTVNTAMRHHGASQLSIGGLLGKSSSGNVTIGGTGNIDGTNPAVAKACTLNLNITGDNSENSSCIGGAVGYINDAKAFTAAVNTVTVSGTIAATAGKQRQQIGGLIAYIEKSTTTGRTLIVDNVTINGLTLNGAIIQKYDNDNKKYKKDSLSMGGLLGYAWCDISASVNSVTVSGTPQLNALVGELNGIDVDMAGLVYAGTGNWTVGTVSILNISVNTKTNAETPVATTNVRSFGMIVNMGRYNSAAIYLVLQNMNTYTLGTSVTALSKSSNFSGFTSTTVFDELVAYSALYDEDENGVRTSKILENGQGIVAIRTRASSTANNTSVVNNVMQQNTCNTYQNQVTGVNMGNPNTRYYYDLDLLLEKRDKATASTPTATLTSSDKLMLWSLNQYAHSTLNGTGKPFAYNPFANNVIAPADSEAFDMQGYSYYPVDIEGATIKGTFKLYNQEIETGEAASATPTDSYARTTLYEYSSAFTTTPYTQHHLMQNGIFLNVNGNITVNGELKLQGTIGADTYNSTGSGALICGVFKGNSDNTYTFESKDGSVVLDGVYVHNLIGANEAQLSYAPLLINRIDSYTITNISDVSNTDSQVSGNTGYPNGKLAATSLIGKVGKKTTEETSQYIKLKFSEIQLDGRVSNISDSTGNEKLTAAYHTTRSIFTRATLLEEYIYTGGGSQGEYNFKHSEDWGGSGTRAVTYGKEIGYAAGTGEFGGKEQRYSIENDAAEGTEPYYARPDKDPSIDANSANTLYTNFASEFLPYVKGGYVVADNKHQINVNHGVPVLTGCGTYNDPYVISSGDQLITFANILNNSHTNASIALPVNATDRTNKWHGTNGCQKYAFNGSQYVRTSGTSGSSTLNTADVMEYVASAYYKFSGDFDIPNGFIGLGSVASNTIKYVFHGVIDGNGSTVTNYSQYPLILNSSGSVVRNLTIKVAGESDITPYIRIASSKPQNFDTINASLEAYGAVIGRVYGGDNILEHISVDYSSFSNKIKLENTYAKDTPVGGYVGVIIAGSVVFKNMTSVSATSKNGLPGAKVVYDDGSTQIANLTTDDNWLYVNPIIGRVINGYAVTESNAYRPFENGTRSNSSDSIYCYWVNGSATSTAPSNPNNVDRVTMHNGTKNYSIPDIVKETKVGSTTTPYTMLRIGSYNSVTGTGVTDGTNKTTVTFPNAQSMFILSCLIQGGVTTNTSNTYANSNTNIKSYEAKYKPSRLANYDHIGEKGPGDTIITNTSDYDGYDDYLIAKDISTINPYLVENYVADDSTETPAYQRSGIYRLTNTTTVCDIGFAQDADASSTWVLPDGFRGLGSIAFNSTNGNQIKNMTLSVNKFSGLINGKVVNLDLNMNIKHYEDGFDNYQPAYNNSNNAYYSTGLGLFNTIRHNRIDQTPTGAVPTTISGRTDEASDDDYKISYIDIKGKINYDVVSSSGSMAYSRKNVYKEKYLNVGGLVGFSGFVSDENLNIEHIGIDGLEVNGFKTAGGILGYLYMANSNAHLATISNIDTDELTVTTKLYGGGIVGYANQIGMTIDEVSITHPDIKTYFDATDYENGVAGIVGCVKNAAQNLPITVSNVKIGDLNATSNSRIGYPESVTPADGANNNRIAAAGVIGESNTNSSSSGGGDYSLIINRCYVYNIDFYGNRVAGILAHDGNGESTAGTSTILISNVEVKSNKGSIIKGLAYDTDNYKNRGCGGVAGYIKLSDNKYVHFDHCTVEGYSLSSYNDTGGLCANLQATNSAKSKAQIDNIRLSKLKYESNYVGGMFGYLSIDTTGYNIQMNDLQFKKFSTKNYIQDCYGYLIGKNNWVIKFVGFSRKLPDTYSTGYTSPGRMTGTYVGQTQVKTGNAEYQYGTNGYVVFADYNGSSISENKNDWAVYQYNEPTYDNDKTVTGEVTKKKLNEYNTFSPIKDGSNVSISSQDSVSLPKTIEMNVNGESVTKIVTDLSGNIVKYNQYYGIAKNTPFVTSSPTINTGRVSLGEDEQGNERSHWQFLTGDGISGSGESGIKYENSAVHNILNDLKSLTNAPDSYFNYYNKLWAVDNKNTLAHTDDVIDTDALAKFDTLISSKYSTFKDVTGTDYPAFMRQNNIDFPVLILDNNEPIALTAMLNKYLQTLTNTTYNFAANDDSSIFELKLAKCEFDTDKFTVTYNASTDDTNNSSLYTGNGNFTFNISNVDSGKAQFTLIDVEFYDPSTSGNSKKVAYHLYVPVYVSQMLVYDLQISSKSGSTYRLNQYTTERGNYTLENLGTPITIEARYIYQRELSDWLNAANNGEKIYRSAPKIWDINDQAHHGFPADTKLLLVDPNQGNKAYYSTLTDQQVYGTVEEGQPNPYVTDQTAENSDVRKLYLNKFTDSAGNAFTARKYNDYLNFTATASNSSAGTFVPASESDATVSATVNGSTVLLKPKTNETDGSFYVLSDVTYSSIAKTYTYQSKVYLMEDYYVTLFTESADTENMYHLGFRAPTDLGDTGYPSRYTKLNGSSDRQTTYILIGNLFTFEDAALTTTIKEGVGGATKGSRDVDIASAIEVEVTNKICLTEGLFNNKSFLSRPSVHIYQAFMLSLNKQASETQTHRGIEAKPVVTMQKYTVGSYNVLSDTTNAYYTLYQGTDPKYDSNYIYLYNGRDLRTSLSSLANVSSFAELQGLEIAAKLSLSYTSTDEISNQYPKREDAELNVETKGTWIGCNSSIASTEVATVGSPMTTYITEKTGETEENPKNVTLYFTRSSASAHLLYKSDDDDGKYSGYYYDQLGINAIDLPESVTDNNSPMNTLAVYDVSELLGVADSADYVELTISMYRKDDDGRYTIALNPADYISNPTFGNTATGTITASTSSTPSNGKVYTYTFNKTTLQNNANVYSGGVYTIPINYTVKTAFSGSDQTTHYYSNYKVIVSASMYKDEVENETTIHKLMNGTDDDDHLIYTNAKINSNAYN